jgi:hypothetical protein
VQQGDDLKDRFLGLIECLDRLRAHGMELFSFHDL